MEMRKRVLGQEHPSTLSSMANLAATYRNQGRWTEPETMEVQVIETSRRMLGEEHPDTLTGTNNLAFTMKEQGREENAVKLMTECFQLRERILGSRHPDTLSSVAQSLALWKERKLFSSSRFLFVAQAACLPYSLTKSSQVQ